MRLRDLKLEPFSLALARRLLGEFPQWEPFFGSARREEDGLPLNVLQVDIPSASPFVRQSLRIVAEPDKLIVVSWFPITRTAIWNLEWTSYAYGDPPASWHDDSSGFDRLVNWLRQFIAEERVASVTFENGSPTTSSDPTLGEIEDDVLQEHKRLIRSWKGTYDLDERPQRDLPAAIVYGSPESAIGKMVGQCLAEEVDWRFATESNLPDTDRIILLEPEWNWSLAPSPTYFAWSDGRSYSISLERRMFIVRRSGETWHGPWPEGGLFEVRESEKDSESLRRDLMAWLNEP